MKLNTTKNENELGNLLFIKEVAKYFMDFLETDFHKRRLPKRSVKFRNNDNLLVGLNLQKYLSFNKLAWKLVSKSFDADTLNKVEKGVHKTNLPKNLLDLIKLQINKVTAPQVNEVIKDIAEEVEKLGTLHAKEYDVALTNSIEVSANIIRERLVHPFIESIEKPLQNLELGDEDNVYLIEEELTSVLLRLLENKISETLNLLLAEEKVNFAKEFKPVFELQDIKSNLLPFFEGLQVADLFLEMFEMERNKSILDKQDFYLYFGDISFNNTKYPIFYIPFNVTRSGDILDVQFDAQVYINKKALEYVTQEHNKLKGTQRGSLQSISERIIYLSQHEEDLTEIVNGILNELTHFFELNGDVDFSSGEHKLARGASVRISNSCYVCLFDKSDEALVNDYEDILQQLIKCVNNPNKKGELSDMFNELIGDFVHKNPQPFNPDIESEWDKTGPEEKLVYSSPIPLNSEQRQILSAVKKEGCKYIAVEGPPGTGKSHTITAIVFDAILKNQSVLVLSDKKEALDVVEDKITQTMNKVRYDKNFQNPILRLGKTGNTYSSILARPTIESIKAHYRAVKAKGYGKLNETISKYENTLKEDIEAEIRAYGDVNIKEIHEFFDLEIYFRDKDLVFDDKDLVFDIDELLKVDEAIIELGDLRISLHRIKDVFASNDFNELLDLIRVKRETLKTLQDNRDLLSILNLTVESTEKIKTALPNKIASTAKFTKFSAHDLPKLAKYIEEYEIQIKDVFASNDFNELLDLIRVKRETLKTLQDNRDLLSILNLTVESTEKIKTALPNKIASTAKFTKFSAHDLPKLAKYIEEYEIQIKDVFASNDFNELLDLIRVKRETLKTLQDNRDLLSILNLTVESTEKIKTALPNKIASTAKFTKFSAHDLPKLAKYIEEYEIQIKDVFASNDFNELLDLIRVKRETLKTLQDNRDLLSILNLTVESTEKIKTALPNKIASTAKFTKFSAHDLPKLAKYIEEYEKLKVWALGFLFSKKKATELDIKFKKDFIHSNFSAPHEELEELKNIHEVYSFAHKLGEDLNNGGLGDFDYVALVHQLLTNKLLTNKNFTGIRIIDALETKATELDIKFKKDFIHSNFSAPHEELEELKNIHEVYSFAHKLGEDLNNGGLGDFDYVALVHQLLTNKLLTNKNFTGIRIIDALETKATELDIKFKKDFIHSNFSAPHEELEELKNIHEVYSFAHKLGEDLNNGGLGDFDYVALVHQLLTNENFTGIRIIDALETKATELDIKFKKDFIHSNFSAPHEELEELKNIHEVYSFAHKLGEDLNNGGLGDFDYVALVHQLLTNENFTGIRIIDALETLQEDFDYLSDILEKYPKTVKKIGIKSENSSTIDNNKVISLPEIEFDKQVRYLNLKQKISKDFSKIPELNYASRMKQVEDLVTTQVTYLLDGRFIKFYERNRSDAETLRKIIKDKKRFPKDMFTKLKNAFPCIIAGIRDYAEYIPLEAGIFDLVIIDEASQVSIAQAFPALLRAKKVLILGDKKQFSNIKAAQARSDTNREYLHALDTNFRTNVSTEVAKLVRLEKFNVKTSVLDFFGFINNYTIQLLKYFRGYKEIISFSNKYFYQESLQVMKIRGKSIDDVLKFSYVEAVESDEPYPNTNKKEVDFIASELKKLEEEDRNTSVGIITPHTNQQKLLVEVLSKMPEWDYFQKKLQLKIMTFDTCQGEERDIIYYSMVASPHSDRLWGVFIKDLSKVDIEEDGQIKVQRLNVGLSRAKERMHFVLSKPLTDYNGSIGEALRHYQHVLEEAKKERDVAKVDGKSKMEPEVMNWFYQTKFWKKHKDNIEFIPQFEIGKYLKQLDRTCTYTHPEYKVDFLLVYTDEQHREHKIIIEYDGFREHFQDIDEVNEFNYESYYSLDDVYRQKVLEGYGYKFLRINKFNSGEKPIETLDKRIGRLLKNREGANPLLTNIHKTIEDDGIQKGDMKKCLKCKYVKSINDFKDSSLITEYARFCRDCKGKRVYSSYRRTFKSCR